MRAGREFIPQNVLFKLFSCLVLFLGCIAVCAHSAANCLKNTNIQLLGKKNTHCRTLKVLPIHLMDNETLFLAAEAQRDSRMNPVNRLLNNRWLLQSSKNTYIGPNALRTALRMSMLNAWRQKHARNKSSKNSKGNKRQQAPLLNINNYDVNISDNKMILGFSYHF